MATLSEEDRKLLYDAIDYDEVAVASASSLPKNVRPTYS